MEIIRSIYVFVSNNLVVICEGFSLLISFIFLIVSIVQKVKTKKINEVLKILPEIITFTEHLVGSGNGDAKLDLVLQAIKKIHAPGSDEFWKNQIESILSAPQKKS